MKTHKFKYVNCNDTFIRVYCLNTHAIGCMHYCHYVSVLLYSKRCVLNYDQLHKTVYIIIHMQMFDNRQVIC